VAIDGVSLTIAAIEAETTITVSIIPQTLKDTLFADLHSGDTVNLEADVLAKRSVGHQDDKDYGKEDTPQHGLKVADIQAKGFRRRR
jgi:riboflavin synthase alpha subunit